MGDLKTIIADANHKCGVERQRVFAKKTFLKQSDGAVIDVLCDRSEELLDALTNGRNCVEQVRNLRSAITIARRQREAKR